MFRYASEVTVERPAAEVFAAVLDIERWTEWTDMKDVRYDQPGPVCVGSSGTFSLPGTFRGPVRYRLTELEADRRVVYEMTHSAFTWTAELRVAPDGHGSRLATSGTFQLRGLWRLLQPIVAREVAGGEEAELVRLKAILEAAPAAAATTVPQP